MPLANFGFLLPDDVRSDFGFQTAILPGAIALGQNFTHKVPGEFFEVPVNIRARLVTDATPATRFPSLIIFDGDGKTVDRIPSSINAGASTTVDFRWSSAVGAPYSPDASQNAIPLLAYVLPSGWSIQIFATSLQPGDQWQQVAFVMQQYNTGVEPERFRGVSPIAGERLGASEFVIAQPVGVASAAPALGSSFPLPTLAGAPAPSGETVTLAPSTGFPQPSPTPQYIPIPSTIPGLEPAPPPPSKFEPQ